MYIKPTRQTKILDYPVIISINTQIEQLQTIEQLYSLIEQLSNTELDKDFLTFRLKKHEDFWIHKLKTLKQHGFNAGLTFHNP